LKKAATVGSTLIGGVALPKLVLDPCVEAILP
jgi:hypothetical protein